ncbi:hypothetical protein DPMN_039836 [Dreissena polymorpha]|uniref:Uncharacterized protein n=1 Tax=Dreissena polymorpha TaxID=45954 RepID=A0A9D4CVJ3_DREPO|nr:hypothetical protein DPMN_039836 [Dreissena polymorpha]
MGRVTLFVVTLAIAFMLSSVCSNSANTTDNGSGLAIAGEQLDGKSLIHMGENMKSTLLKLLGKSFENFERKMNEKICEIDPCDQWSPWSKCSARLKNTFGFRSRSRVCWIENTTYVTGLVNKLLKMITMSAKGGVRYRTHFTTQPIYA